MYLGRHNHNLDFRDLAEKHGGDCRYSLVEAVHLVVRDAPYTFRLLREVQQSNHDKFSVDSIKEMSSLFREVVKAGSYGHMFCTECGLRLGTSGW